MQNNIKEDLHFFNELVNDLNIKIFREKEDVPIVNLNYDISKTRKTKIYYDSTSIRSSINNILKYSRDNF